MQIIHLPFPPSVNTLYPGKARRHKSKKYLAWIKEAGVCVHTHMMSEGPFDWYVLEEVEVLISVKRPDKRRRDVANLEKAVTDLLVAHQVIEDDSQINSNTQIWRHDGPEGVLVYIKSWDEGDHFVRIPE